MTNELLHSKLLGGGRGKTPSIHMHKQIILVPRMVPALGGQRR